MAYTDRQLHKVAVVQHMIKQEVTVEKAGVGQLGLREAHAQATMARSCHTATFSHNLN
jgi:hypothetical protein